MQSLTWPEAREPETEPVPDLFLGLLLRAGVAVGVGCAAMLWGVRTPGGAVLSLVVAAGLASLALRGCPGVPDVGTAAALALRAGLALTAAGAVVELGQGGGVLLVGLALAVSPGLRRRAPRLLSDAVRHVPAASARRGASG